MEDDILDLDGELGEDATLVDEEEEDGKLPGALDDEEDTEGIE